MLIRVEVRTAPGNLLLLPLGDYSGGYLVKEIEGLDPVKANLVSSSFANQDGEQYHSSRRETRDIVIKLGLDTGNALSVKALRNRLYGFFMPKSAISLRFVDSDGLSVDIQARIEDFDCPLFVQEPVATITTRCFDPDFYEPTPVVRNRMSAPDTVAPEGRLTEVYNGTIETGFVLTLNVTSPLPDFTIYHAAPDGKLRTFEFSEPLQSGDTLKISSVAGAKSAMLTRNGLASSVLYGVSPQSPWLELQPGSNGIRVYTEGAEHPYTIEYTTKHGGL